MKLFSIFTIALSLGLAGCGIQDKNSDKTAQGLQSQDSIETMIAKVPLDANGNEMLDQMELRVSKGDQTFDSQATAESVFKNSIKTAIVDELDSDTSAQSYFRRGYGRHGNWRNINRVGNYSGRGQWWGRTPYIRNVYSGGFGGYTPYFYRSSYNFNNYRYYTWCNNRNYGYGW
jgi:hypothetical protein